MLGIVVAVIIVVWMIGFALRPVGWLAGWGLCLFVGVRLELARTPAQRAAWMREWDRRHPPHVAGGS